jgi:activator of 2-hydroxyglutaryl-CoA dehydratase
MGHAAADIIAGLCQALVRNYINNLLKGKEILEPILFMEPP